MRRTLITAMILAAVAAGCGSGRELTVTPGPTAPPTTEQAEPISPLGHITNVSCGADYFGAFVRGRIENASTDRTSFMIESEFRDRAGVAYGTALTLTEELAAGAATEWEGRWGGPLAAVPTDEGEACGVVVTGVEPVPAAPPGFLP